MKLVCFFKAACKAIEQAKAQDITKLVLYTDSMFTINGKRLRLTPLGVCGIIMQGCRCFLPWRRCGVRAGQAVGEGAGVLGVKEARTSPGLAPEARP